MTAIDDLMSFLDIEIGFYRSMDLPPLRERLYCRLFKLKPWQDRMTERLEDIYHMAHMISTRPPEKEIDRKGLIEALAWHAHSQWMEWSKAIAENECLSPNRMRRWQGELWKPYSELTEDQKEQDRIRAREILAIVEDFYREGDEG